MITSLCPLPLERVKESGQVALMTAPWGGVSCMSIWEIMGGRSAGEVISLTWEPSQKALMEGGRETREWPTLLKTSTQLKTNRQ